MSMTVSGRLLTTKVAVIAVMGLLVSLPAPAQSTPRTSAEGAFHHYTADLDGGGPWQIVGPWSLRLNTASDRVEFVAALSMVRSDAPARAAHTHHVSMTDGRVTTLANGHRISGTATITSNGSVAGFSGSPIDVEISGAAALPFSNIKLTLGGAATGHFGAEPVHGVVDISQ